MIYCDSAAAFPVLPQVWQKIHEFQSRYPHFAGMNISSSHQIAKKIAADFEVETHRFFSKIGVSEREWFWTSGATESNHWAFQIALENRPAVKKIFLHPLLHASLRETAMHHAQQSHCEIHILALDTQFQLKENSSIDIDADSIVILPLGDNEIGSVQKNWTLVQQWHHQGAWIHVDAAQSFGKVPIHLSELPIDSLTVSGHKMGALTGIGGLFVRLRPRKKMTPLFLGGGQQHGYRSGTLPVLLIMSFIFAFFVWEQTNARVSLQEHGVRLRELFPESVLITPKRNCLPHFCVVQYPSQQQEKLNILSNKVAFSLGSACRQGQGSQALLECGIDLIQQQSLIRLSLPLLTESEFSILSEALKESFCF